MEPEARRRKDILFKAVGLWTAKRKPEPRMRKPYLSLVTEWTVSLPRLVTKSLREEFGLLRQKGIGPYGGYRFLAMLPLPIPDRLAARMMGLKLPPTETEQLLLKRLAVIEGRIAKRYGSLDRAPASSVYVKAREQSQNMLEVHKQIQPATAKEALEAMRTVKYFKNRGFKYETIRRHLARGHAARMARIERVLARQQSRTLGQRFLDRFRQPRKERRRLVFEHQ